MNEYEKNITSNVYLLAESVAKAGCLYTKGDREIPSKTGEFVYEMGKEEKDERFLQVSVMGEFFAKKSFELIKDFSIRSWLGVDEKTLELFYRTNPNKLPWTLYYGLDFCGEPFVINDLNPDRAVVIGYQPEIAAAFSEVYPSLRGKTTSFYDDFVPLIKNLSGEKPGVFVLTEEQDPHEYAYRKFATKFGFAVGNISEYDSSFDVVIRALKTSEIVGNQDKYAKLIKDATSGLPIVNPLGSYVGGNKGWMTLMRANKMVPEEWFPDSWLIKNRAILSHKGQINELGDIQDEFTSNRKKYVLKEAFSAGGWKVHIGAELKLWQWNELWKQVNDSMNSWVVESLQSKNEKTVLVGEQDEINSPITVKRDNLNIIQRVYSVYPFSNFHTEVFGKHGLKVNASGYSFPVSYSDF